MAVTDDHYTTPPGPFKRSVLKKVPFTDIVDAGTVNRKRTTRPAKYAD
jgi:hypothetical protein